jgi:hypothetical protein
VNHFLYRSLSNATIEKERITSYNNKTEDDQEGNLRQIVLRVTQIRVHHVFHKKGNFVLYRKIEKKNRVGCDQKFQLAIR